MVNDTIGNTTQNRTATHDDVATATGIPIAPVPMSIISSSGLAMNAAKDAMTTTVAE